MEFHPADAVVPEGLRTDRLILRPLRVSDVDLDYDAVMSSAAELRRWGQTDWPADDFTRDQNRDDLERHEREHRERKAFTYTVLDPTATRCLGCVYITPLDPGATRACEGAVHAANVGFWVRASELAHELDHHLLGALRDWLEAEWAFDALAFTVAKQETRQAALLAEAGLEWRADVMLSGGRSCRVFVSSGSRRS